jgi:hypothetical protein
MVNIFSGEDMNREFDASQPCANIRVFIFYEYQCRVLDAAPGSQSKLVCSLEEGGDAPSLEEGSRVEFWF